MGALTVIGGILGGAMMAYSVMRLVGYRRYRD